MNTVHARFSSAETAVVVGAAFGVGLAFLGLDAWLKVWPALLAASLMTRYSARSALFLFASVLSIMTIAQLNSTLAIIPATGDLEGSESQVYDHASRILRGEPLYSPLDRAPFSVVAYMPLYYSLVAILHGVVGPGFWPGRALSCFAGLVAAASLGHIVGRQTGARSAGLLAGLFFLTFGFPWVSSLDISSRDDFVGIVWKGLISEYPPKYPWLAFYKVDVLGVALSVAAISTLHRANCARQVVIAGVLAGLALLTKQTLVAASLAGAFWLWRGNPRWTVVFVTTVLGPVILTCSLLEASGGALLANTISANLNPMSPAVLAANLPLYLRFQAMPLLLALLYALGQRGGAVGSPRLLLVYYWIASALPLTALAKVGGDLNHWLEFAAATSILATLTLWNRLTAGTADRRQALVPVAILAAGLLFLTPLVGGAERIQPGRAPRPDPAVNAGLLNLVERVRATRGDVLADPMDVIALADRPILLEPYIFSILQRMGRWDPAPVVRQICGGQVGLLVLINPIESGGGQWHGHSLWPPEVISALRKAMVFDSRYANRYLYVPRTGPPSTQTERDRATRACVG